MKSKATADCVVWVSFVDKNHHCRHGETQFQEVGNAHKWHGSAVLVYFCCHEPPLHNTEQIYHRANIYSDIDPFHIADSQRIYVLVNDEWFHTSDSHKME